jgi:prepilin-type N-terminal cleavage/methylation domain-containing protein
LKHTLNKTGFTLIEILISVAILGMVMLSLGQLLGSALSAQGHTGEKQELMAQARYAMERMVMFVEETDSIIKPDTAAGQVIVKISERVIDTHNNASHTYLAEGDGLPDADNDTDGLINNSTNDPPDYITFDLDETDMNNRKLREQMPDYSNTVPGNYLSPNILCEHVKSFQCKRLAADLVEIQLSLQNGNNEVSLKTRTKARRLR